MKNMLEVMNEFTEFILGKEESLVEKKRKTIVDKPAEEE